MCVHVQTFIYLLVYLFVQGADPPKQNVFIKNCVFILTCLNFSHLQSTLYLMQYTYRDVFSTLRTVFEITDFDAF